MGYITIINELLQICAELIGLKGRITMHSPEYIDFEQKLKTFANRYDLLGTTQWKTIEDYFLVKNNQFLANEEVRRIIQCLVELKQLEVQHRNRFDRIFISHSSEDIDYVKPFVELLESLGLNKQTMFCSSVNGYGIPIGHNIYDYLKTEFTDKNILVLMIMSDNYYRSKPCLNEMGATWVMSKEYLTILIKGFEFNQIEGSVDQQKIGFKITNIDRLNEFKDKLVEGLNLIPLTDDVWNALRDKFLSKVSNLHDSGSVNANQD